MKSKEYKCYGCETKNDLSHCQTCQKLFCPKHMGLKSYSFLGKVPSLNEFQCKKCFEIEEAKELEEEG